MKKIFVSGGSHCIGGGFNWQHVRDIYEKLNIEIKNQYDVTYPKIVAEHFQSEIIFEGDFGGSINKMIRKTYEYIFSQNFIDTFFIFEVPPGWRDEFYSNNLKRMVNMTIGNVLSPDDETELASGYNSNDMHLIHKDISNYFYNFVDYELDKRKWFMNFIGLLSFLKLNQINYLIIDTGDFQQFLNKNKINENTYNFLWFDNGDAMHNWINNHKLTIKLETNNISNDEHLGIKGHQLVANKIIEYVEKNKTSFS